nr:MAG TPA: hypothetical protein [Caudoviricetes sp.]
MTAANNLRRSKQLFLLINIPCLIKTNPRKMMIALLCHLIDTADQ